MPWLTASARLPGRPSRVLVAGTSGAGKTTLASVIAAELGLPHFEIDALHHGPNWSVREEFVPDVQRWVALPAWVTEWQYSRARPLLAARAEVMVWLDLPRWLVMSRVSRRTVRRSVRREILWNGNVEPPLREFFYDRDHVVRWAWRTHPGVARQVIEAAANRPALPIVRLCSRREVARWVAGPLQEAVSASPDARL
jgi:adenylate kinase family enzyme